MSSARKIKEIFLHLSHRIKGMPEERRLILLWLQSIWNESAIMQPISQNGWSSRLPEFTKRVKYRQSQAEKNVRRDL